MSTGDDRSKEKGTLIAVLREYMAANPQEAAELRKRVDDKNKSVNELKECVKSVMLKALPEAEKSVDEEVDTLSDEDLENIVGGVPGWVKTIFDEVVKNPSGGDLSGCNGPV